MTDKMTDKQWFAHLLTEHLGDPNIEKKGGIWPPAGNYQVTFQALDLTRQDDMSPPACMNIQHGFLKIPYMVDKAALPSVRGKQYDYLLWFSNDVGAQISQDRLCDLVGMQRPNFNTKTSSDTVFELAVALNGKTLWMQRTIEPDKKGVRRAKDQFRLPDAPTTTQVSVAPEPSLAAIQSAADDGIPF